MPIVSRLNLTMLFFVAVHAADTRLYLVSLTPEERGFRIFFGVERAGRIGLTRCCFRASDDLGTTYAMAAMVDFDDGRAGFSPIVTVSQEEGERHRRRLDRRQHRRWHLLSWQEFRELRRWHRAIGGNGPILATGAGVAHFSPALDPAARRLRVEMIAAETCPRDQRATSVGFIAPDPYPGPWVFTIPLSSPKRDE